MYSYYYDRPDLSRDGTQGPVSGPERRYDAVPPPEKEGRSGKAGAVFCLFLALMLLGGLCLVAFPGKLVPEEPVLDMPSLWEDQGGEITMERAPVGNGPTMRLTRAPHTRPLTPGEVYEQSAKSVVAIRGRSGNGTMLGTGVILSSDGYIITNHHVIDGAESAQVTSLDGSEVYDALLVGSDAQTDLAVLKIEAQGLPAAEFGDSAELRVGDPAYAVGNPLGEQLMGTMTDGIVSYVDRTIEVGGNEMQYLQTSAALNSGNSGGALVNQYGQVVGITTMKMSSDWNTIEGLGFAIPTAWARFVVDELIETGHIGGRPTIGITVGPANQFLPSAPEGLWVMEVVEGSDADKQGIRPGDIIMEANGIPTPTIEDLTRAKEGLEAGDTITFRIIRQDKELEITVELVEKYTLPQ